MIVRAYFEENDFEAVKTLLEASDVTLFQKNLGGHALVLDLDGTVIGFAWALISPTSTIAYVDFLVVAEKYRGQKLYGPLLVSKLLADLEKLGKTLVLSAVMNDMENAYSLSKIYQAAGMEAGDGRFFRGNLAQLRAVAEKRYAA